MATAPLTEVRDKLSESVDQVAEGVEWTITRHGRTVAVMLIIEDYESLLETVNVLSDADAMESIREGLAELEE